MKLTVVFLIIGIILTSVGFYMFMQYENSSVTVDAVVTDIDIDEDNDDSSTAYVHTYYGEYTVNGKKYTGVKLSKRYTNSAYPEFLVGSTMEVTVNGNDPEKPAKDGGFFSTVGVVMVVVCIIKLHKNKKKQKVAEA